MKIRALIFCTLLAGSARADVPGNTYHYHPPDSDRPVAPSNRPEDLTRVLNREDLATLGPGQSNVFEGWMIPGGVTEADGAMRQAEVVTESYAGHQVTFTSESWLGGDLEARYATLVRGDASPGAVDWSKQCRLGQRRHVTFQPDGARLFLTVRQGPYIAHLRVAGFKFADAHQVAGLVQRWLHRLR